MVNTASVLVPVVSYNIDTVNPEPIVCTSYVAFCLTPNKDVPNTPEPYVMDAAASLDNIESG